MSHIRYLQLDISINHIHKSNCVFGRYRLFCKYTLLLMTHINNPSVLKTAFNIDDPYDVKNTILRLFDLSMCVTTSGVFELLITYGNMRMYNAVFLLLNNCDKSVEIGPYRISFDRNIINTIAHYKYVSQNIIPNLQTAMYSQMVIANIQNFRYGALKLIVDPRTDKQKISTYAAFIYNNQQAIPAVFVTLMQEFYFDKYAAIMKSIVNDSGKRKLRESFGLLQHHLAVETKQSVQFYSPEPSVIVEWLEFLIQLAQLYPAGFHKYLMSRGELTNPCSHSAFEIIDVLAVASYINLTFHPNRIYKLNHKHAYRDVEFIFGGDIDYVVPPAKRRRLKK